MAQLRIFLLAAAMFIACMPTVFAGHSSVQLCMKEAMDRTYADIVREQDVRSESKQKWLRGKISMNMAYLQFVGTKEEITDRGLNGLICHKLKEYLPPDIEHRPGFRQSLD